MVVCLGQFMDACGVRLACVHLLNCSPCRGCVTDGVFCSFVRGAFHTTPQNLAAALKTRVVQFGIGPRLVSVSQCLPCEQASY